jgi:PAS domain S-box-containing protein
MQQQITILHVEDEPLDADLIRETLATQGVHAIIFRVETEVEFRRMLLNPSLSLILTDYALPAFDGMTALKLAREIRPDLPFIFVSGTIDEEVAVESLKSGAKDYVSKHRLQRLPITVHKALADASEQRLRAEIEAAQRESQQQYEALVHSIDGIVWEMDAQSNVFTFVSQQVERLMGYPPDDWMRDPNFWSAHLHPDDANWVVDACRRAVANKEDHQFDYRMIASDGRIVWLRDFVTVDTRAPDKIMLRGVMVDITEQKRVQIEREIILEVIKGVITTRNLDELLKLIHLSISKLLYAENCFIALHDPTEDLMHFEFWLDRHDPAPPANALRKGFSAYVLRNNEPLLLTQERRTQMYEHGEVEKVGTRSSSWIGVPLRTPSRVIGVMVLQKYEEENAYSQRDLEFLTSVGDQIALAIERKRAEQEKQKLLHDVGERVKELTALHRTAQSLREEGKTIAELLNEIAEHLRSAYQFPLITEVRIQVGDVICETDIFTNTEWQQRADFVMTDGRKGVIEVVYLESRPEEDEGPFLAEERHLIDSVAEMLRSSLERKRTDLALRESEERYRDMVENARDILYSHDLQGNYTSTNKAAEVLTGYTQEECLKLNILDTLAPESIEKARRMISGKLAGEDQAVYDLDLIAKDGHKVTVEVSTRLAYQDGAPVGVQGIARDITDRKRAEKEKTELTAQVEGQRQRLNTIIGNVPGIVWETWEHPDDARQHTNFVSDYVEALLGYSVNDWLGTPDFWLTIVHPEDRDRAAQESAAQYAAGNSYSQEFRLIARDERIVWVQAQTSIICDEQKKPIGARGVILDITERKLAEEALHASEEQLRQSHKLEAIGQLAGGVAHDFNNLLTVITGYSDLVLRRIDNDNPLRPNLEEIKKAGERAASLTRQLLAFSRKQVLQPKVLQLNAIVADIDKMLRRLIGEDIDLLTLLEPSLGRIKADPGQIEQVIMNLAVNARDAMPHGGKLTIETANVYHDSNYAKDHVTTRPGHYVMLVISDTGTGMDAEIQTRIFDPFFTTKGSGKGTGLGLSTVYGIVKQSEGNIWVYSEKGRGTTFKIYLPCVDESALIDRNGEVPTDSPQGLETILLAEDEEQVRQMTRGILEMSGYRVLDASNGQEALSIFRKHRSQIDLVLTDAVMPQMGGRELAENLYRISPGVKVLYMSGYTEDAIVRHGLLDQSNWFLEKPFTPDALMRKLREVLDAPIEIQKETRS